MTKAQPVKSISPIVPMPETHIAELAQNLRDAETIEAQLEILQEKTTLLEGIIELSTMPYSQYLRSDWWKSQRERALGFYGNRCAICDADDRLDVHHRTYANRGWEPIRDLIVLCRDCHTLFHENGKLAPRP